MRPISKEGMTNEPEPKKSIYQQLYEAIIHANQILSGDIPKEVTLEEIDNKPGYKIVEQK